MRPHIIGACLGMLLLGSATVQVQAQTTYYTRQQGGSDAHTCAQAQSSQTPRASINGGFACLAPGDTLRVGPGTYDELLQGQDSASRTCGSSDASVQPGCARLPNGLDAQRPTRLVGDEAAIISPAGRRWPGGGLIMNLYDYSRDIHIEGLRFHMSTVPGSTGGLLLNNSQRITLTSNEFYGGPGGGILKSGLTSRYHVITHNNVHHGGRVGENCIEGVANYRCPHGMYLCGQDHVISDNWVHHNANYGIHVSCEHQGIERIKIERNRSEENFQYGIRCGGTDCVIASNLLLHNGGGISISGSGLVAHNTIHHAVPSSYNSDPNGIWNTWGDGSGFQVVNNLLTDQKSAFLLIGISTNQPPNATLVHHNMCEIAGNKGCTLIAQDAAIYRDTAAGDFTLKTESPARQAGVVTPVLTDFRGQPYPSPPDLGAYSSTGAAPPTGDTTPPSVQITTPVSGAMLSGTSATIQATASDNVAVVRVQFYAGGQAIGQAQSSAPYRSTLDTTTVPNGPYTLTADAVDAAGNRTISPPVPVTVRNGPIGRPIPGTALTCTGTVAAVPGEVTLRCTPEEAP